MPSPGITTTRGPEPADVVLVHKALTVSQGDEVNNVEAFRKQILSLILPTSSIVRKFKACPSFLNKTILLAST